MDKKEKAVGLRRLVICVLTVLIFGIPAAFSESAIESAFVLIHARPDFAFTKDLTNTGAGEVFPIEKDYYLSRTKVTNAEYKRFVDATGHKAPNYWENGMFPEGKADHPVVSVSYSDAVAYCEWMTSQYDGWIFRLPTEAEWENAARGTLYHDSAAKYPAGRAPGYDAGSCTMITDFNFNGVIASELMRTLGADYIVTYIKGDYQGESEPLGACISISSTGGVANWANHGGNATRGYFLQTDVYAEVAAAGGRTSAVTDYPANTFGLYDMAGNCWDLTSSVILANNGLEKGVECYAVRGGSWYATARSCTMTYRGEGRNDHPSSTVGFRLAAERVSMMMNDFRTIVLRKTCEYQRRTEHDHSQSVLQGDKRRCPQIC